MTLPQTDCPLCGGPNACAVAAGGDAGSCWCHSAVFSDALLDRVPADQRGQVCLCGRCASWTTAPHGDAQPSNGGADT